MSKFDPNKHRKTRKRIAELPTKKTSSWEISKPKNTDYIQIWGKDLEDLDVVNIFEQRDGGGKIKEWLIQGVDDETEDQIITILNPSKIKSAIVCPCVIRANNKRFIWLAKQAGPAASRTHEVHEQIKKIIPMAQGKWMMIGWDDNTREYIAEEPAVAQSTMEQPTWPNKEAIDKELGNAFDERIIEDLDNEIIKRTQGTIK